MLMEKIVRTDRDFLALAEYPKPIAGKKVKLWYDDFSGKIYPPSDPILSRRMHSTFSFHYVLEGEGWFAVGDGERRLLKAGDVFFIYERRLFSYYPNPENPWKYCGISVAGANVAAFFQQIGWNESRVIPASELSEQIGSVIVERINRQMLGEGGEYDLLSGIYRIFAILEHACRAQNEPEPAAGTYVRQAKEYVERNYSNPDLRIPDIAEALNLSHSYLCRIFRKQAGCSAEEYLVRYRMSVANRLLTTTDYQVSEVAFLCGYTDPSHFSRMYRNQFGVSPRDLRK